MRSCQTGGIFTLGVVRLLLGRTTCELLMGTVALRPSRLRSGRDPRGSKGLARFDLRVEDTRTVLDRRYRSGKVDEHCALFGWQGMILVCAIADRLMDGEGLMWEVDQQGAASAATGWAPRK